MSFSDLVIQLLDKRNLDFDTVRAPEQVTLREDWLRQTVPLHTVARINILQDKQGYVLAFYPASDAIDMDALQNSLHRKLHFVDTTHVSSKISALLKRPDSQVNQENGIQIIIDENLSNLDFVHFEAPRPYTLLRLPGSELQSISDDVLLGCSFITSFAEQQQQTENSVREKNQISIQQRLQQLTRLPAMPDMPARILNIRNDPNSTVDDLIAIIQADVSLSAQILRYANSALFAHNMEITSLKDAIFRVLGYETVLHLSLGYALGRIFKLPEKGPLGNTNFWQHATYSAALVQRLARIMPKSLRPKPGIAYLAGLLHDVGFLVLNLFFKNEHAWLNKMIIANPDTSIIEMEQRLLGTSHNEIGAWLMRAWNMPDELTVTVEHHHNLDYNGAHAEFAALVNLSERLFKTHGMADAETDDIPLELLNRLGLEEEQVYLTMDEVLQGKETFRAMATAICA